MNDILVKQLALDFCCTEEEVRSRKNVFTQYVPRQGRRIFKEGECFLKVAAFRGKLLFTGKEEIISWAEPKCKDLDGSWFMEADTLRSFDQALSRFGCRIKQVHPFFIAHRKTRVDTLGFEIRRYVGEEIGQFRGDDRFGEAFLFADAPKDVLGVAALAGGRGDDKHFLHGEFLCCWLLR